ncbi:MAG: site-specific DNA-methyltransferase [Ahrensia sp.]|nr:site-specific DNA-methyltransferase [Ahrensia sp.]
MTAFKSTLIGSGCHLMLGDSMKIMPWMSSAGVKFNCVVTDPPYLLESGGNKTGAMGGKFSKANYDNSGAIVQCDITWSDFMPEISALVDQGHLYLMCNNRHVAEAQKQCEAANFKFHNLLVWKKSTITPNRWYMKNAEFVLFMYKGKAQYINDCGSSQVIYCPTPSGVHPNEKPVALMEHFIKNSTKPGDLVFDPFMGSGTTGVACAKLGRRFIGIEIHSEYFQIACDRISDAYAQPQMFKGLEAPGIQDGLGV